jgi:hypothetical protein
MSTNLKSESVSETGHTPDMRKDERPGSTVSETGHTNEDEHLGSTVSGTGHKKRDWKAINAKRATSVSAKLFGTTRYNLDQLHRLHRFAGDEFDKQIMSGELTIPQAFKILPERYMASLDEGERRLMEMGIAESKVRKYSRLMAAAVRQTGIPEHQIESCIIEVLKDELSNGREHR